MKSPHVVHFRCLDTFGLRGVAQSYGAGGAGMRLTRQGLAAYVRPSRHALEKGPAPPVVIDEEPVETFVRSSVAALPPRPRPFMPSLVTIEMGLRRPTTWAVLLLTLGVSFGVVLARVASRPRATSPVAMVAAAAPRQDRIASSRASSVAPVTPSQETPTLATTVISAAPAPGTPLAHASSAQTRALHSSRVHHATLPEAPVTAPDDKTAATAPPADADGTQDVSPASAERVQQELSDSL